MWDRKPEGEKSNEKLEGKEWGGWGFKWNGMQEGNSERIKIRRSIFFFNKTETVLFAILKISF